MRNSKLLLVGIGLLLAGALVISLYAGKAQAGITTTKHNMAVGGPSASYGSGTDQICIFCHTPHNAKSPQLVPLWNHTSTSDTGFTMYSSVGGTIQGTIDSIPNGISKACLSCHDGTVAVDAYGTRPGTDSKRITTGSAYIGKDLSNDHPISITYRNDLDIGLKTVPSDLPLYSNKVECSSCHSVHDDTNGDFLRASNAGSALCLKCHNK